MKLQAVKDKVIVKVLVAKEKKTESGIVLTEDVVKNQEPQIAGVVVSFGDEVSFKLNVGDIILCHSRGGMDILLDGVIYKVLGDNEIYGILMDEEE